MSKKIYLSSTFKDLKEYRKTILDSLQNEVFRGVFELWSMENYASANKNALDKCLEDVRNCDIYVLLLGKRYGFIKDDMTKSITHLEFEAAKEKNILVFTASDACTLIGDDYKLNDEQQINYDDFKKSANSLIRFAEEFKNADHLTSQLLIALSPFLVAEKLSNTDTVKNLNKRFIYNCDRSPQWNKYKSIVEERKSNFFLFEGSNLDSPEGFINRIQYSMEDSCKVIPMDIEDDYFISMDIQKNKKTFYQDLCEKTTNLTPTIDVLQPEKLFNELFNHLKTKKILIKINLSIKYFKDCFKIIESIIKETSPLLSQSNDLNILFFLTLNESDRDEIKDQLQSIRDQYENSIIELKEIEPSHIKSWIDLNITNDIDIRDRLYQKYFQEVKPSIHMSFVIQKLSILVDDIKNNCSLK